MADWSRLSECLRGVDQALSLTWDELGSLVGGLPNSATNHRAWWSGDRPHVRAWRSVGFNVADLQPGVSVTFIRSFVPQATPGRPALAGAKQQAHQPSAADLLLVTCVKSKGTSPSPAKDLYTSPLFLKQRAYAQAMGVPWFILSAEYGLVQPDEWLSPYERYLPDLSAKFRQAWSAWVVARLELLTGNLRGRVVEIHAGSAYMDAVRPVLEARGAAVRTPLAGLTMGQRLSWYKSNEPASSAASPALDTSVVVEQLGADLGALKPREFLSSDRTSLDKPGLYSWWVDPEGAADLSAGLGIPIAVGLIYAGLAGATRSRSGRRSKNTLWGRVTTMHLGGRHEFSTFRLSIGSILAEARGAQDIDEDVLTAWMHEHLRVVTVPVDDADSLDELETSVLIELDPPLNLAKMRKTPVRERLTVLRRKHGRLSRTE